MLNNQSNIHLLRIYEPFHLKCVIINYISCFETLQYSTNLSLSISLSPFPPLCLSVFVSVCVMTVPVPVSQFPLSSLHTHYAFNSKITIINQ